MMFTKMWDTILVYCSSEVKILLSAMRICASVECYNSTRHLDKWKKELCVVHNRPHDNCGCPAPFRFHYFPKSDLAVQEEWVRRVGRQEADGKQRWEPRKDSVLCSEHFVNGAPSAEYPIPWFKLGQDFGTPRPARRASDKHIVNNSGFLDLVEPQDTYVADKGFPIRQELLLRGADLVIPPPARGKVQSTGGDVKLTKKVANLRIHVERAIGRLKWFRILQNTLPITLVPLIDHIVIICAALCNLHNNLV